MKKLFFSIAMGFLALTGIFALSSCSKDEVKPEVVTKEIPIYLEMGFDPKLGVITLNFSHFFEGKPLELKKEYKTAKGETFTFDQIRYWVSNVELLRKDGSAYLVEDMSSEFMLGLPRTDTVRVPANKREKVIIGNIPVGDYVGVRFGLGVDEAANKDFSITKGELDINRMFLTSSWVWKTSYIFTRTSGNYKVDIAGVPTSIGFYFESGGNTNYRTVSQTFAQDIRIAPERDSEVTMNVELQRLFDGINIMGLPQNQVLPGWSIHNYLASRTKTINAVNAPQMTVLADNASKMFSISRLRNVNR
jgi:hypothetical protein